MGNQKEKLTPRTPRAVSAPRAATTSSSSPMRLELSPRRMAKVRDGALLSGSSSARLRDRPGEQSIDRSRPEYTPRGGAGRFSPMRGRTANVASPRSLTPQPVRASSSSPSRVRPSVSTIVSADGGHSPFCFCETCRSRRQALRESQQAN